MKSSSGAVHLCLDSLTILEGETDIVGTVDGGVFDKAVPAVNAELFQRVRQLLEGLEEGFIFSSLYESADERECLCCRPPPPPPKTG